MVSQLYSADVSLSLDGNKISRIGDVRGDICISFSCDPDISSKLVDLTLDEILQLQVLGYSEEEVARVLGIEQRSQEIGLEENYYWLNRLSARYRSRYYFGDIGTTVKIIDGAHLKVRNSLTPATAQLALQRILPFPYKKEYTMVVIVPQTPRFKCLNAMFPSAWKSFGRDAKELVANPKCYLHVTRDFEDRTDLTIVVHGDVVIEEQNRDKSIRPEDVNKNVLHNERKVWIEEVFVPTAHYMMLLKTVILRRKNILRVTI